MKPLYVKTTFAELGEISAVHIAELTPIEGTNMCTMNRLIEMLDGSRVSGIWTSEGASKGMMNVPNTHVPHPDSYGSFPDIAVEILSPLEFEGLWITAASSL